MKVSNYRAVLTEAGLGKKSAVFEPNASPDF